MRVVATASDGGKRLDTWLRTQVPDLSRSRIQALIRQGAITVPGSAVTPHSRVTPGMVVEVDIPPPQAVDVLPEAIPLDVLFEDHDLIVVNKPAGMVVHPAPGHASGTLVNALLHHCKDLGGVGGELRPGIVHRLDKDTSGVIVVAKHARALDALSAQFKQRETRKTYLALVCGRPSPASGTIETEIGRSRHDRKKMSTVTAVGRSAVSHYTTREAFEAASLVEIRIETGRTHQIRVHMAHIGCPVVGDMLYGSRKREQAAGLAAPRQILHAAQLGFTHPETGKPVEIEAPWPADMVAVLAMLRKPLLGT